MTINHTRNVSEDIDPFDTAENYYNPKTDPSRASKSSKNGRVRTFSMAESKASKAGFLAVLDNLEPRSETASPDAESSNPSDGFPHDFTTESLPQKPGNYHVRRASLDNAWTVPKRFLIKDIDTTLEELLKNEDTDHNFQITIDDSGPKTLLLGTANSNGFRQSAIRGTYMLSNLLQELTIAKRFGRTQMILDESRLCENPVSRMKRLINTQFWPALTRQITKENIVDMAKDTKIVEEVEDEDGNIIKSHESVRLYIPYNRPEQYEYFSSIKKENPDVKLDVQFLPENIDAEFIKSINKKPGLLALETKIDPKNKDNLLNEPYVVPGGRFNELYGWDSYMIILGLLLNVTPENQTNLKLSRGMTENFIYEINHYNKILNANRSYYLGRSQPPFLTDMALRTFKKDLEINPNNKEDALDFLMRSTLAAIKEYNIVWCCPPRLDPETNLSCYHPEGVGIPPETESSHFNAILKDYIEKYGISQDEFIEKYNSREILEPALDEYFLHDRAVRESGHDTTYRLEGKAAYLATVDLNSLLYKYEIDIANIIKEHFNDGLENPATGEIETSGKWYANAKKRQENITKYLWNEKDSMFYDYHVKEKKQHKYESATCFWPLWSKVATTEQADMLVRNSLTKFEEYGGLVSGTLRLRGEIGIHRPSRQWDYPYGWAPQQILAWIGLANYNYNGAARRLVYRWLHMMTRAFVDYNGVVVEKYNVLKGAVPHKVDAEYGNQGADFKGVATEGFGWVNSSFLFGLTFLNLQAQRSIGALIPPDVFLANLNDSQRDLYS